MAKSTKYLSYAVLEARHKALESSRSKTNPANDNGDPPKKRPGPKPNSGFAVRGLTGEKLYRRPK